MNLLGDALKAAQRGWHVFPVQPGGKTPHLIQPDEPYQIRWSQEATTDVAKIVSYWQWSPSANIGIACAPSNLFVVDCDLPKAEYQLKGTPFAGLHETWGPLVDGTDVYRALCERLGIGWDEANGTYRVCTGSMGCHYYYRWPTGIKASQASIIKGLVDVRGNGGDRGGYVLGAQSLTDKGPYVAENDLPVADCPPLLVQYLTDGARDVTPASLSDFVRPSGTGTITGLEAAVLTAPEGNRNNALLWAARAAANDRMPMQEVIDVLGEAYRMNNGDGGYRQAEQTIRSAYRLQEAKVGR